MGNFLWPLNVAHLKFKWMKRYSNNDTLSSILEPFFQVGLYICITLPRPRFFLYLFMGVSNWKQRNYHRQRGKIDLQVHRPQRKTITDISESQRRMKVEHFYICHYVIIPVTFGNSARGDDWGMSRSSYDHALITCLWLLIHMYSSKQ